MTFKFYCRKDQIDNEGLADIIITVNNRKVKTNEKCKPTAWKHEAQMVDNKYKGAALINNRLKKVNIVFQDILDSQQTFDIGQARRLFENYLINPDKFDISGSNHTVDQSENFFLIIEGIIDSHRNEWSFGHKKKFRTLRAKFLKHKPDFKISDISLNWWQDYVDHCFDELNNKHNTIQTDFKATIQLCDLLKDAGRKFNHNIYKAGMSYVEPKIEPMTFEEIELIANLDLSDSYSNTFADSRFLWVLGCYLGQRWKDMSRINKFSFYQKDVTLEDKSTVKVWYYTNRAQKTKKLIDIPLLDEAVDWLKKRKFEIPVLTQQTVNRDIKLIARSTKKFDELVSVQGVIRGEVVESLEHRWKRIHIHTGRHSFAVELVKRSIGRPYAEKFVSEMLGHASPATTWKYFNFVMSQKDKMFIDLMKKPAPLSSSRVAEK